MKSCTISLSRRRAVGATLLLPFIPATASSSVAPLPELDVPYVPTPPEVVDKMLELARIRPGDLVYDLGCGDGRIVIAAASRFGARGVGIDIDPQRIAEAKANAITTGVADRTRFEVGDLFKSDFSDADAVMLYLLPAVNVQLRPQLWQQLRIGTRVVSHQFHMGPEWPPEQTVTLTPQTVYAWTIDARVKAMLHRGQG